jgi:dTDP-4-dehydrorhamnose 3,5-epimerase-like enzyme
MAKIIKFKSYKDKRGILTVIEKEIKFRIKRVYFIYGASGIRGQHRHKKNIQALISINGSCKIFVNDGKLKKMYSLNKKNKCLLLEPKDWHYMKDFSKNCILLVLCSESYKKSDYIDNPY